MYLSLKTVQEQAQSTRVIKLMCHRHLNFEQVTALTGEIIRDSTARDFKMWPLAVLMVTTLTGFFSKEMYGRFAGPKKSGRKAGFHGGQG